MAKLPANFNWKESATHIQLLEAFSKPRDVNQVLDWQFLRQTLGEKTENAIERFVREGVLIPATLDESLGAILQVADLKKMLQAHDLRQTGNKSELIKRLLESAPKTGEDVAKQHRVLKCSEPIQAWLIERKNEKEKQLEIAQRESFERLKEGNAKDAYKVYAKYQKQYSYGFEANTYMVEELQFITSSCPSVLGDLSSENKRLLQAASAMRILWRENKAEFWLPEGFTTAVGDNRRAINYLIRNADFRRVIEEKSEFPHKFKVSFQDGDIESCQLCMKLNEMVFEKNDVPELPMKGCTSETGCMCRLDYHFEDDEDFFEENEDDEDDNQIYNEIAETNPVKSLKILKQLLDEGLITQNEYDEKKKEILSRL